MNASCERKVIILSRMSNTDLNENVKSSHKEVKFKTVVYIFQSVSTDCIQSLSGKLGVIIQKLVHKVLVSFIFNLN